MSASPPSFDMTDPTESGYTAISRVLSEETDESPFASNLVTPTDEDAYPVGIQERLDAAQTALSYFASKELTTDVEQKHKISLLNASTPVVAQIDNQDQSRDVEEASDTMHDVVSISSTDVQTISSPRMDTLESSDTITSSFSSDSFREGAALAPSIYTLPNDHINVSTSPSGPQEDAAQPLLDSDSYHIIKQPDLGTTFWMKECESLIDNLTFRAILSISLRLVCFLPWCAAVGAALILSPEHLEFIAFRPGYIKSLSGIRRYAYWAEYGYQHVVIFVGALAMFTWIYPTAGFVVLGGLLAQFCMAWHTFLLDRNIPLGDDDQQSVFLLATTSWLNDTPTGIRKVGESYYFTDSGRDGLFEYDEEGISAKLE
ncbi:hypothetical protein D9619_007268 [Psilocybe cf. subviscida]|uniref:Uncharacterized protein n=1 Tax=Psilocybe cf. subviscida TaxID=2480587 RepID=A0A8H5EW65_9AGAR|nr:hypothetical protein D9619_007268 [Psilocybe cf. subviscida]